MRHAGPVRAAAATFVVVALALAGGRGTDSTAAPPAPASSKLRADLAALVDGSARLDARLPQLVAGYRPGDLAYFVVLTEPNDAAHQAELVSRGARILRRYASVNAFAVASGPAAVLEVASIPWVAWLAPAEVVLPLDHEGEGDQSRGTTGDVGAPALWNASPAVTGSSVTIAVLDTGIDAVHPDLDDLDFRHWSNLLSGRKVVDPVNDARNFNGSGCEPLAGNSDFFGHGTHVAGIAAGTGEGAPLADDNGRYAGIAPAAKLAIAKVLTDAGYGSNVDLIAALEWAAMPKGTPVPACANGTGLVPAVGAEIVNLSLGSEARPLRLNSDSDVDLVSEVLNGLAVRYGTLFAVSAGNSGPFSGSLLEAPAAAAQALSVSAAAKTWDVNDDMTLSGDSCAGWRHPGSVAPAFLDNECDEDSGDQPASLSSFTSRGPSGDVWLRPDVAAPGYNIVSAQASAGAGIHGNDFNIGTRGDPFYATATGTSMAAPAVAGAAALLLDGYRSAHGSAPSGASGVSGLTAPAYVLVRAALMNTALAGLYDSRWILTRDEATPLTCPVETPFGICTIFTDLGNSQQGSSTVVEARNKGDDPFVGPLAEGAGKIDVPAAAAALRSGVVVYSAASGTGQAAGTGHRDFQGTWQVGAVAAGSTQTQRFVAHAAPGVGARTITFSFAGGTPSDGSTSIPASWVTLPAPANVSAAGDALFDLAMDVPARAGAGVYTGMVEARVWEGVLLRQILHVPVFAAVLMHDVLGGEGVVGDQGTFASAADVFGKWDTRWPSAAGQPLTGTGADWRVFPVELGSGLVSARFSVYDSAHEPATETYDLYVYDEQLDLLASTHPFLPGDAGVTDVSAATARTASSATAPQTLTLTAPASGRYYVVASRANFAGGLIAEGFGSFVLTLDEVRPPVDVSVTKTDSPDPVVAGQELTYSIRARNDGPGQATGVVVTDTLPAGATFVSAGTTQGSCVGTATVTCAVGALASGATASVTIRVRPNAAGTLANTASVTANETDPDPADNVASATTTVAAAADIAVANADAPDPVRVGQNLTYTIPVTNNGPSAAAGVTLDVQLPKNAGYGATATTQGSCTLKPSKQAVSCSLGSLAAGATATVTVIVKPTAKGTITSTATAKATAPTDPNAASNTAKATTTVTP